LVLAAIVTVTGFLPTSYSPRTAPVLPTYFPEINHAPILIQGDANFTQENGVRRGSGTASDPFVINDWGIWSSYNPPALEVRNTRAFLVIFNVTAGEGGLFGVLVLANVSNVRIEAVSLYGAGAPLLLIDRSRDVTVTNSEIGSGASTAIMHSDQISLTNNTIGSTVDMDSSTNVTLRGNMFVYGGITWHGSSPIHFSSHVIAADNLAQGQPIRYFAHCVDQVIDGSGVGQVLIADCDRVHVSNMTLLDPNAYAKTAIQLAYVRQANISSNRLRYVQFGIVFDRVADSVIFGNMVRETSFGITLRESTGNRVFHNDLIGMDPTSYVLAQDDRGAENNWSAPYPTGGNYWSRYNLPDACSGPNQDPCAAPDGIVDIGFAVDSNTTDPYPLTLPATFVDQPPVLLATVSPPPIRAQAFVLVDAGASYDSDGRFWFQGWEIDGPAYVHDYGSWWYLVFESVRVYTATLTAQDDVGVRSTISLVLNVTTPLSTPTASIAMTIGSKAVDSAIAGDVVTFDGSGSSDPYGPIVRYTWSFPDGTVDGRIVSHAFMTPGRFDVNLVVVNDRDGSAVAQASLTVFAPPVFEDFASPAGFRLPIPTDWTRQENVGVGDLTYQLVLTGPSARDRPTRIGVETDKDSSVRETKAYFDSLVETVMSSVRSERPDAYLDGSPSYSTIFGHASVTFVIRYPSDGIVQEATVVVSEAHERFWLFLLTVDASLFLLGDFVLGTMAKGFEITLAPIPPVPPNLFGVPLSGLVMSSAIVLGVFGVGLALRTLAIRASRKAGGRSTSPFLGGLLGVPRGETGTTCPVCASPLPPGGFFCTQCGRRLR
jgi:hypothetical protein